MQVKLAENIGFCSGVKRAFEIVLKTTTKAPDKEIYTLGPIIHNPQAVELLKEKGVKELRNIQGVGENEIVVIRSHGISPQMRERLKETNCQLVDATCPKVRRVQELVRKHHEMGYYIILVGDKGHAEIEALVGFANDRAIVVETPAELQKIDIPENSCVLFQTTYNREDYEEAIKIIKARSPKALIYDTLCNSTQARQKELIELARDVEALVIVGGKNSANTRRLFQLAVNTGKPTFFVESADELRPEDFQGIKKVGVAAGASTPSWIISEVVEKLERINESSLRVWQRRWLKDAAYFFLQSKIFTALGSLLLTLLLLTLLGLPLIPQILLFPAFFLLAMHTFQDITDWSEFPIGDVSKIGFFRSYRRELRTLAWGAIMVAVFIASSFPFFLFSLTLAVIFIGVTYTNKWLPRLITNFPFREIVCSLGWIFATIFVPIKFTGNPSLNPLLIATFIASLVIARAFYSSVKDLKSDRILGVDSLVSKLGVKKTQTLIDAVLLAGGIAIFISAFRGLIPAYAYIVALLSVYLAFFPVVERGVKRRGSLTELLLDTFLYIAGVLAIILRAIK